MDKLKAMATFVQIADAGSLTAAARAGGGSLPAVVRSLAALEAHLGVRLFNRTTRRISLTAEGRQYLERCRAVLSAVTDAENELALEAVEPSGRLVVTAPALFGQMYVAPAVTRFAQRHPKVRVRLLLSGPRGQPAGGGRGRGRAHRPAARFVARGPDRGQPAPAGGREPGVPGRPGRAGPVRRTLRGAPCVGFTFPMPGRLDLPRGRAGSSRCPSSCNLEFNQAAPAAEAVLAGLGFGMFIEYQVAPYLADGRLRTVLAAFEPPRRPISIVYPHARGLPARTRVFVAWMKQELGAHAFGH